MLTALSVVMLLASGCAPSDPFAQWNDCELAERVEALTHADAVEASLVKTPGTALQNQAVPGDVGLAWYVDQAIQSNAQIRAARQRVERLRERIPQATALPDPTASITFGQLAQTAAGQVDYIVGVQQSLPFPGTLDARGQVARQQVVEALHQLQTTVDQVRVDTQRAYWSYFDATFESKVLQQNRELLMQIESAVRVRVRVGQASQADLLRVSRQVAALDNQLSKLRQRQTTASAMLTRLISRRTMSNLPAPQAVDWQSRVFDRQKLLRLGMQTNPNVMAAQARVGTFRQRLDLAKQERLPDFFFGLQYAGVSDSGLSQVADGQDQIAGTVGVSVPLWSGKYDAAEREAMRGMGEALAEVRAAQDRVAFEIDEALARIEANEQTLKRLRERMMPDARQTINVALTGYRTGEVNFLQLLDDWQALLDDQLQETRVIAALYRAAADLQQALGRELNATPPEIPPNTPPETSPAPFSVEPIPDNMLHEGDR